MLQLSTLGFLRQLRQNNNKAWFEDQRFNYDVARHDFESFVSALLQAFEEIDPAIAAQEAKHCIYRIYRDVRFSNDKTPYKNHFSAYFARGGRKWEGAGYYLHLEPGSIFAGGGMWMPTPPLLKKVRQEIDYDFHGFKQIIGAKSFTKTFSGINGGESLTRPPKGYDADNPAIEYLKMKSIIASHPLTDEQLCSKQSLKSVMNAFQALSPLINFLNRATEG
ncbi:MAG: DUF2461 domain-containing protein [Bacteroidetes bacterium]|nr:DUF2461 domain-containing protein [Bacteroidota bacterium]MBS1629659.1 DUF2461 domain-containing protein [Bacteroidota bacterium]